MLKPLVIPITTYGRICGRCQIILTGLINTNQLNLAKCLDIRNEQETL